eukprot:TRINITY_DN13512_c0_g1_i3.p1 TRINITY_DN13512_c0_g1~~TRINITY_DN13512_c0_g1_i3.p1  ORF type:complete len:118 (+),score=4.89 TRINITY_DN13512_c0_g1_i3:287-640(+)
MRRERNKQAPRGAELLTKILCDLLSDLAWRFIFLPIPTPPQTSPLPTIPCAAVRRPAVSAVARDPQCLLLCWLHGEPWPTMNGERFPDTRPLNCIFSPSFLFLLLLPSLFEMAGFTL